VWGLLCLRMAVEEVVKVGHKVIRQEQKNPAYCQEAGVTRGSIGSRDVSRRAVLRYDNDQVHHFLLEHFLDWLEALSWMQETSEGIHAIASLESTARVSKLSAQHECSAHLLFRLTTVPIYTRLFVI
jgi:hypothetical protein